MRHAASGISTLPPATHKPGAPPGGTTYVVRRFTATASLSCCALLDFFSGDASILYASDALATTTITTRARTLHGTVCRAPVHSPCCPFSFLPLLPVFLFACIPCLECVTPLGSPWPMPTSTTRVMQQATETAFFFGFLPPWTLLCALIFSFLFFFFFFFFPFYFFIFFTPLCALLVLVCLCCFLLPLSSR